MEKRIQREDRLANIDDITRVRTWLWRCVDVEGILIRGDRDVQLSLQAESVMKGLNRLRQKKLARHLN
jgi:hypothetical protein